MRCSIFAILALLAGGFRTESSHPAATNFQNSLMNNMNRNSRAISLNDAAGFVRESSTILSQPNVFVLIGGADSHYWPKELPAASEFIVVDPVPGPLSNGDAAVKKRVKTEFRSLFDEFLKNNFTDLSMVNWIHGNWTRRFFFIAYTDYAFASLKENTPNKPLDFVSPEVMWIPYGLMPAGMPPAILKALAELSNTDFEQLRDNFKGLTPINHEIVALRERTNVADCKPLSQRQELEIFASREWANRNSENFKYKDEKWLTWLPEVWDQLATECEKISWNEDSEHKYYAIIQEFGNFRERGVNQPIAHHVLKVTYEGLNEIMTWHGKPDWRAKDMTEPDMITMQDLMEWPGGPYGYSVCMVTKESIYVQNRRFSRDPEKDILEGFSKIFEFKHDVLEYDFVVFDP